MYVLFHGSKKNVGDYLIRDRAYELINNYAPSHSISQLEMVGNSLKEEHRDLIKESSAVIIAGGPAYKENFFPNIYPSLEDILDMDIPIIPLGVGWNGKYLERFSFTDDSKRMLKKIHSNIRFSGVRDIITKKLIKNIIFIK